MESNTRWIDEREVSRITGRALSTLRSDRHRAVGIPYTKFNRQVLYKLQDVIDYMESRKIKTDLV